MRIGETLSCLARQRATYCISGHRHDALDTTVNGVRVLRSPDGYLESDRDNLHVWAEGAVGLVEL